MTKAEREKYVAWWLYESGLELDEFVGIATMLVATLNFVPDFVPT